MSQTTSLPVGIRCDDDAPRVLRVRGYWSSVGFRLRHDPATLVFGLVVQLIVLAAAG